jgi:hypothetical protein
MYKLLTPKERALAEYMSELSEEAYCTVWMTELEYSLWEAVIGVRRQYGRTTISQAKRRKLRELSESCAVGLCMTRNLARYGCPLKPGRRSFRNGMRRTHPGTRSYHAGRGHNCFSAWEVLTNRELFQGRMNLQKQVPVIPERLALLLLWSLDKPSFDPFATGEN